MVIKVVHQSVFLQRCIEHIDFLFRRLPLVVLKRIRFRERDEVRDSRLRGRHVHRLRVQIGPDLDGPALA